MQVKAAWNQTGNEQRLCPRGESGARDQALAIQMAL